MRVIIWFTLALLALNTRTEYVIWQDGRCAARKLHIIIAFCHLVNWLGADVALYAKEIRSGRFWYTIRGRTPAGKHHTGPLNLVRVR